MSIFKKTEIRFDNDFYEQLDIVIDSSEEFNDVDRKTHRQLVKETPSLYLADNNKRIKILENIKKKIEKKVKSKPKPEDDLYVHYFNVYQTLGTSYAYNHQLKEALSVYQEIYEAYKPDDIGVFDNILALTYALEGLDAVDKLIDKEDPIGINLLSVLFKAIISNRNGEDYFLYLDRIQNNNPFFYYLLCEDIHPDETEFPILRSTNLTLLLPASVNYAVIIYAFLADVFDGRNDLENEIKKIIPRHPAYGLCNFFDEFERALIANHYSSSEDEDGNFIFFTKEELYKLLTGKDIYDLPRVLRNASNLLGILPNLTEKTFDADLENVVDFGILNAIEIENVVRYAFSDCCDLLSIFLIQSKTSQMHSLNYKVRCYPDGIEYACLVVSEFRPGYHKWAEYHMRKDTSFDALCRLFVNQFDMGRLSNPIFIAKGKTYNLLDAQTMTLENLLDDKQPAVFINNDDKETSLKLFYHPEKNVMFKSHQPIHFNKTYSSMEGINPDFDQEKEDEPVKEPPDNKQFRDYIQEVNDRLSLIR